VCSNAAELLIDRSAYWQSLGLVQYTVLTYYSYDKFVIFDQYLAVSRKCSYCGTLIRSQVVCQMVISLMVSVISEGNFFYW